MMTASRRKDRPLWSCDMRHKVKWLFVWICLVLWLGNAWGCATRGNEQNYKASQPEHPSIIEREDASAVPTDGAVHVVDVADAPAAATAAAEITPSVTGLDRSQWPKIQVGPERGITPHFPIYYTDYPADRPEAQVNFNDPQETQLEAALTGSKDHGLFDGHHALQLLSQPSKVGLDTLLLPVRMVITPPWTLQTTP